MANLTYANFLNEVKRIEYFVEKVQDCLIGHLYFDLSLDS